MQQHVRKALCFQQLMRMPDVSSSAVTHMEGLCAVPTLNSRAELPLLDCGILPFIWLPDGDIGDQVLAHNVPALGYCNQLLV